MYDAFDLAALEILTEYVNEELRDGSSIVDAVGSLCDPIDLAQDIMDGVPIGRISLLHVNADDRASIAHEILDGDITNDFCSQILANANE